MASFKGIKKSMLSLPIDVRMLHSVFSYQRLSGSSPNVQVIQDWELEHFIYRADSIINIYLAGIGGYESETPYYTGPLYVVEKPGEVLLEGVTVGSSAITEQWKIVFGISGAYTVYGSFSGNQGTGDITTAFTSTNTDLSIAIADWRLEDDTALPAEGDTIFIGVYKSHPAVKDISSWLAAALMVDAKYTQSESIESGWGKSYYKKAIDLLTKLADPDSEISLSGNVSGDISDYEGVSYDITPYGDDATKYLDLSDDVLPY